MLIFLDETFRTRTDKNGKEIPFGALCGVGIPIDSYSRIANAIFRLKLETMGKEYAESKEMKGKKLLNNRTFRLMEKPTPTPLRKTYNLSQISSEYFSEINYPSLAAYATTKNTEISPAKMMHYLTAPSKAFANASICI